MEKKVRFLAFFAFVPWWVSANVAIIVYVSTNFILPTVPFDSLFFRNLAAGAPRFGTICTVIFVFAAILSGFHSYIEARQLETPENNDVSGSL